MTNVLSIIISLIILLFIIFIKDINSKKTINTYHGDLYIKLKKQNKILIIISIITFISVSIINIITYKSSLQSSIFTIILNALTIALIPLPISITNTYNKIFNDEEKILDTKYIITTIYDKKMINKFNKAGLKVVILSLDVIDNNIKAISPKDFNKDNITTNLIVDTEDKKIVKGIDKAYYEYRSLNKCYQKIEEARSKADTIARIIKYNTLVYLPLFLLYILLTITKFPVTYNILFIMIVKLITTIVTEFIYPSLPEDNDLMERMPIVKAKIIGKQEILFIVFTCLCTTFCYSLPYQYILSISNQNNLAISLIIETIIFNNLFITYVLYSESFFIKNIFKSIKNLKLDIYSIILIIISILINFITCLGTTNIGLHNYFMAILFGLVPLLILEIIKFARFTTIKGVKKHEHKNNKKHHQS